MNSNKNSQISLNLRRTYSSKEITQLKLESRFNLVKAIKNWLFWRKAKKRHKQHAKNYAIFEEDNLFYAAIYNWLSGWEFLDNKEYFRTWSEAYRRDNCSHKTRYAALRCIINNRYNNLERC